MRNRVLAYVSAAAALAGAVLLRWLLDPVMGDTLPLVTLFGAVATAAWVGGYRPAAGVAILGYVACSYLFIEPRGRLGLDQAANVVGLLAYLFTCALIIGFGEAMRSAQARASEQRELMRVTLQSIGDAVITTDNEGRITYLNTVAESLTGWTQADALGHPLGTVFRIVNEETRGPVENPAARALRDGVVVGLANHTLLIRRDGSERPIDDSAAPIRNEHGDVSGCVLIFRDVTAQRRMEQDKASQLLTARLLASIVESSDDAIIAKSLDGIIQSWNAAAERLFGHTAAQAVGRHISLVIPPDRIAEEDHDHRQPESGPADRALRDRADAERRPAPPGVSHDLAHQGRRGPGRRGIQDRPGRHAPAAGRGARARSCWRKRPRRTPSSRPSSNRERSSPGSWPWTAPSSRRTACRLEGCGYTKEQVVGKPFWEGPWWAPSAALAAHIKAGCEQAAGGETFRAEMPYFVGGGSERVADVIILPIRDRPAAWSSWRRPAPTSPTASGPKPTARGSSRSSRTAPTSSASAT